MKKTLFTQAACVLLLGFLLGSYNGQIALWKGNDPQPWRVFPYSVSSLPLKEQEALKKGIRIDSFADLNQLLENFLS